MSGSPQLYTIPQMVMQGSWRVPLLALTFRGISPGR